MQSVRLFGRKLAKYISTKPENILTIGKTISYKVGEPKIIDVGEKGLAIAVIMQAWMDANYWNDTTTRRQSRAFLTGKTQAWKESLEFWCWLSGHGAKGVMDKARRLYCDKDKIEEYRKLGK